MPNKLNKISVPEIILSATEDHTIIIKIYNTDSQNFRTRWKYFILQRLFPQLKEKDQD